MICPRVCFAGGHCHLVKSTKNAKSEVLLPVWHAGKICNGRMPY